MFIEMANEIVEERWYYWDNVHFLVQQYVRYNLSIDAMQWTLEQGNYSAEDIEIAIEIAKRLINQRPRFSPFR